MTAVLSDLTALVSDLRSHGYSVVGPTVRDAAIVLTELDTAAQLPYGWGVRAAPGRWQLRRRTDNAAFGHASGPQSWKQILHPPRTMLWSADRAEDGFTVDDSPPHVGRLALLGVRACDLRAIAVQQRIFPPGGDFDRRLAGALIVAVNCTEPADTCFCVAAGGGPRCELTNDGRRSHDIVLTELVADDGTVSYLADAATEAGAAVLARLPHRTAHTEEVRRGDDAVAAAATAMTRTLPGADLPDLLRRSTEALRWDDVASRCLTCGNCTMVCPTCFCTSVTDTADVTGDHAERWQEWASCFDLDYSELHGGPVRASSRSRYRQWLTHKFGTWYAQFGESGCVGCGRCIAWCPVGIDVTQELNALAEEAPRYD